MKFYYPPGATPLDPDEAEGLIPTHIVTHSDLNEWEQSNILEAERWSFARKHEKLLTEEFFQDLHKRMFGNTWRWAGKFRKSNKNIGVDWEQVPIKLRQLLDDINYQIEKKSYHFDELVARFHHRLVAIHLFPNGNGRHARLLSDILLVQYNQLHFTWGRENLYAAGEARKHYIDALKKADQHDYRDLLTFVRS